MRKKELQLITEAAAKNIKTKDDFNPSRITVETALNAELEDQPGFGKGGHNLMPTIIAMAIPAKL